MISERMIASNRSNGRHSRGPRTAAGKASSSRNALQHGLSVSVLNDPATCAEVEMLACAIAGPGANEAQLSQARLIAEAQLDLARVQGVKVAIMNSDISELMLSNAVPGGNGVPLDLQNEDVAFEGDDFSSEGRCAQEFPMTPMILRQLSRLERYEGRAISRRRRAMRAFLALQLF
jgi:hypothetical protein